jgi:hypothetical protein
MARNMLLFNLAKGLIYGLFVGLVFGVSIYLTGTAVAGLGFLSIAPTLIAALVFANGVFSGVAFEYGKWIEAQGPDAGLLFGLAKGLLYGVSLGLYFGLGIFLLATAVVGLGFLIGITATALAALVFAACILMFVSSEYGTWLYRQMELEKAAKPVTASPG